MSDSGLVFEAMEGATGPELESVSFFNSARFWQKRNVGGRLIRFLLLDNTEKKVYTTMYCMLDGTKALSPFKAPYGSIECLPSISSKQLHFFIRKITKWLNENKINALEIVQYPDFYFPEIHAATSQAFIENGIDYDFSDKNQYLKISGKVFESLITEGKYQRLKKCYKEGFEGSIGTDKDLEEAYDILTNARDRKSFPVSMTLQELQHMFRQFPENYILFIVKDKRKIIAISVCILINSGIIYDFNHAELEEYLEYSPVVQVLQQVYIYCQRHEMEILDLGTSGVHAELTEGVYTFKKELGSLEGTKNRFKWIAT